MTEPLDLETAIARLEAAVAALAQSDRDLGEATAQLTLTGARAAVLLARGDAEGSAVTEQAFRARVDKVQLLHARRGAIIREAEAASQAFNAAAAQHNADTPLATAAPSPAPTPPSTPEPPDLAAAVRREISNDGPCSPDTRIRRVFAHLYALAYDRNRDSGATSLGPYTLDGVPVSVSFSWGPGIVHHPFYLASVYRQILVEHFGMKLPKLTPETPVKSLAALINMKGLALDGEALVPMAPLPPPYEKCGACPNATFCAAEGRKREASARQVLLDLLVEFEDTYGASDLPVLFEDVCGSHNEHLEYLEAAFGTASPVPAQFRAYYGLPARKNEP